jgi:hypothetical protein
MMEYLAEIPHVEGLATGRADTEMFSLVGWLWSIYQLADYWWMIT